MIMQKHDNFNDPLFIYLPLYTFIIIFFSILWFIANNAKYTLLMQKKKKFPPCERKKQTRQWEKREIKAKAICQVTILTAYTH